MRDKWCVYSWIDVEFDVVRVDKLEIRENKSRISRFAVFKRGDEKSWWRRLTRPPPKLGIVMKDLPFGPQHLKPDGCGDGV
jgi:hypothetical protein